MSPTLKLRQYQLECVDAIVSALDRGVEGPAAVLPTGAGKSVIIGALAARPEVQKRGRVLVLAHREELIEQNAAKVRMTAPDLRVGIVKAGRNEVLADVISATVQTLASERRRGQLNEVGLVVYDECHHATSPTSRDILNHYKVPRVGFTATMTRADKSALGEVWTDVVYSKDIAWMIRRGYLCAVDGKRVKVAGLDLAKVKRMHGDYSEKALGEAIEGSMAPGAVARSYAEHAMGRQGILFAPTVSSAEVFAAALAEQGVKVETIHGKLGTEARRAMLQRFRDGTTTILSSVGVLTEGTDLPMAEVAIMCRPTTNVGLYVQCVGRVLRLHPGKSRALVLDLVGVTSKLSLVSPVQLFGDDADEIERDVLDMERDEAERDEEDGDSGVHLLDGPLEAEDVDLFHGSQSAWLRTHDGTWFLPAGARFIALIPAESGAGWHVVAMNRYMQGDSRWVARDVPELGYAMSYAEGDVTKAELASVEKERSWRGMRPDHKIIKYARSIGVRVNRDDTMGAIQAGITQEEGSRRIDPLQRARMMKGAQ
jgi:superfamily II DNA or RNA helicase